MFRNCNAFGFLTGPRNGPPVPSPRGAMLKYPVTRNKHTSNTPREIIAQSRLARVFLAGGGSLLARVKFDSEGIKETSEYLVKKMAFRVPSVMRGNVIASGAKESPAIPVKACPRDKGDGNPGRARDHAPQQNCFPEGREISLSAPTNGLRPACNRIDLQRVAIYFILSYPPCNDLQSNLSMLRIRHRLRGAFDRARGPARWFTFKSGGDDQWISNLL